MDPLIKTEHLRVIYNEGKSNEYVALNDINLEIYPHEYVIFFGPSGCGKSTLLYTILGLQPPAAGKVYLNGRDSNIFTPKQKSALASDFFGIIFQNFNLIYSLNVQDNVMLPQIFKGVAARERRTRATQLLERFGIAAQARRLAGDLSGGQQQRVAICRALINNPTVLLADEPVGNLDSESAEIVMSTLREINERDKKTIVLVTHDASYLKFADRIFYFKDAHIEKVTQNKATGPELLSNHKMVSPEFIGLEKTAHIYPDLTPTQLKAWSLTNYLTETITNEQSLRLEQQLELLLTGTISQQQFFESLHTAYGTGGIGLYWATAASYARTVCDIIAEVAALKKLHGVTTSTAYHHRVIRLLRKYLFQKYRGVLSQTQITRIEDALYRRAQGMIDETTFAKCLAKPLSVGGVGLNIATIKKLQNVLEIIFAQMYEGN